MTARWHVEPIGMDDAARAIGVCRRLLSDILARHPHYETRGRTGRKKVFYPEHIDRIREALQCEKTGNPNSTPNTDGRSNSRSKAGEFAAEAKLARMETAPFPDETGFYGLIGDGLREAEKAMRKFPQPNYVISKVAEEAGEVVKAAIHCAEGRETTENLRGEMKQLIAMLYRLWVEGDGVHGLLPCSRRPYTGASRQHPGPDRPAADHGGDDPPAGHQFGGLGAVVRAP